MRSWELIYPRLETWIQQDSLFHVFEEAGLSKRLPGFYLYHSACKIDGELTTASGCDTSRKISKRKAISEIFERYLIQVAGKSSSNGCALSYSSDAAKEAAKIELFERDRIFNHYLTCTPFLNTTRLKKLALKQKSFLSLSKSLKRMGIAVEARELLPTKNYNFVTIAAFGDQFNGKPFGVMSGFGGGTTLAQALDRATFELAALLAPVVIYPDHFRKYTSINEFRIKGNSIDAHKWVSLSLDFGKIWRDHFFKVGVDRIKTSAVIDPEVSVKSAELNFNVTDRLTVSLFLGYSESNALQRPFFGAGAFFKNKPRAHLINQVAQRNFIENFRNIVKPAKKFSISLPNFPHPLA